MYGAIIGDIVGSRFEFDRGGKTKDFDFFTNEDCFTDDTVMTIAVADALMQSGKDADVETIKDNLIKSMQYWAEKYPDAGYGGRFYQWLFGTNNKKPYGSYGNGSAMRVSAAGWLYDTLERTIEVAKATAEVTHNHPEGVKGATCTAAVIFLARIGKTKKEIKRYVENRYDYDLSETLDQMRNRHDHDETCQDSMPKALKSFFEGTNYEDVVRNAVSLGGDTDTLAAIAGAMAEAYYGINIFDTFAGLMYLTPEMCEVLGAFDKLLGRDDKFDDYYGRNTIIKESLAKITGDNEKDDYVDLFDSFILRMLENGQVPVPMIDKENALLNAVPDEIKIGETFSLPQDVHLTIDFIHDPDGNTYYPLYTCQDEVYKGSNAPAIINMPIETILQKALKDDKAAGAVLNPFGKSFMLTKDLIKTFLDELENVRKNNQ